jgi:pimeloyl-ACP methyl ester carboxylesterase
MSSWHNWETNLDARLLEKPQRHNGFHRAWESMKDGVCTWLAGHKLKRITLTGHSLGGAIATVAALDLATDWSIDEVVVFGCPRVGSDEFANYYSQRLGAITVRYVKTTDLVPRVPWEFMGYSHVGTCVYLNRHGERVKTPRALLERGYILSDLEEKEQPKYLGKYDIPTPTPALSPVRFHVALELLAPVLSRWVTMALIVVVVLLVDGWRHPMSGYIKLLERQLERGDKQTS